MQSNPNSSYIKLYGLKFSKEDHVNFIKILLEILCIPHLETSKVSKFCTILNELLRWATFNLIKQRPTVLVSIRRR